MSCDRIAIVIGVLSISPIIVYVLSVYHTLNAHSLLHCIFFLRQQSVDIMGCKCFIPFFSSCDIIIFGCSGFPWYNAYIIQCEITGGDSDTCILQHTRAEYQIPTDEIYKMKTLLIFPEQYVSKIVFYWYVLICTSCLFGVKSGYDRWVLGACV